MITTFAAAIRHNMRYTHEFVAADPQTFAAPIPLELSSSEVLVGWYRNPAPWNHLLIVFSTEAVYANLSEKIIRIPYQDIVDYTISGTKADADGVSLSLKEGSAYVKVAGVASPGSSSRDAYMMGMVLKTLIEHGHRDRLPPLPHPDDEALQVRFPAQYVLDDYWPTTLPAGEFAYAGLSGAYTTPSPHHVLVVARGCAHWVDVRNGAAAQLSLEPICQLAGSLDTQLLLLASPSTVVAYDANGHRWTSPRLANHGVRIAAIDATRNTAMIEAGTASNVIALSLRGNND